MGRPVGEGVEKPFAGWLSKQHHAHQLIRSQWAMRYFRMDEIKGRLHMSKGPNYKATQSVSVSEISHVTRLTVEQSGGTQHAFEICFPPMRLVLAAADADELSRWITHLEDRANFWREKWRVEGPAIAMTTTGSKVRESGRIDDNPTADPSTAETG